MALSTHTSLSRFSCALTGVLYKLPFAEFVEKRRISVSAIIAEYLPAMWKSCSRVAAFQNGDGALSLISFVVGIVFPFPIITGIYDAA